MRKPEHSVEQIIAAGLEIQSRGDEVSGWKIRTHLGGGKTTRYSAVWSEYLASLPVESQLELPAGVSGEVERLIEVVTLQMRSMFASVNAKVLEEASSKVVGLEKQLADARKIAAEEAAEAHREIEAMEALVTAHQRTAEELTIRNSELSSSLQSTLVDLAQSNERLSSAEIRFSQLKADKDSSDTELSSLRLSYQDLLSSNSALKQSNSDLQLFLDTRSNELSDSRRHEQAARERETSATLLNAQLERLRVEDAAVCQRLRLELSELSGQFNDVKAREMVALSKVESLINLRDEDVALVSSLRAELAEALAAAARAEGQLSHLREVDAP